MFRCANWNALDKLNRKRTTQLYGHPRPISFTTDSTRPLYRRLFQVAGHSDCATWYAACLILHLSFYFHIIACRLFCLFTCLLLFFIFLFTCSFVFTYSFVLFIYWLVSFSYSFVLFIHSFVSFTYSFVLFLYSFVLITYSFALFNNFYLLNHSFYSLNHVISIYSFIPYIHSLVLFRWSAVWNR